MTPSFEGRTRSLRQLRRPWPCPGNRFADALPLDRKPPDLGALELFVDERPAVFAISPVGKSIAQSLPLSSKPIAR